MLVAAKKFKLKNGVEVIIKSPAPGAAMAMLDHITIVSEQSYRNLNHPRTHWQSIKVDEEKKMLEDLSAAPNKFMLAAFAGSQIVGSLSLFGQVGEYLKHNARLGMGIQKDYHDLGLGTALIEYAMESARQLGIKRVELTVRTYNLGGIALYEKTGFRRVGELKKIALIEGQYCDEYMYEKWL